MEVHMKMKIFTNHVYDKGLYLKYILKNSKCNIKKLPNQRIRKRNEQKLTKKDVQKAYKHFEICCLSLPNREIQVSSNYNYSEISLNIYQIEIRNGDNTKCCQRYKEIQSLIYFWQKCKIVQPSGKQFGSLL